MGVLENRAFGNGDEVTTVPRGRIEVMDIAGRRVGRVTYEPGWRWQTHMKPVIGGEACPLRHVGVTISGHLHVRTNDGREVDLRPGEVFVIEPNHEGWVVGDEPWVSIDFEAFKA
jgi:quercetin dioxygenase-like cupin family protein